MRPGKIAKIISIIAAGASIFVLILLAAAYSRKRAAELRTRDWIEQELEARFQSNVDLEDFHVEVFPRMIVNGEGLSIHYRNKPETTPMIRIEKFSFELGFWGIFRAPHRIQRIHVQRMVISVPSAGVAVSNRLTARCAWMVTAKSSSVICASTG